MRAELKRPYPRVRNGDALSCGGDQNWFPDENFRRCGCGVIACADALLYLRGAGELSREEYMRYVNSLRRYFPLIPRRGIDGARLALGLNALLRRSGLPYRARWGVSGAKFRARLERMLSDDLPAIVAIGPNFPKLWGAERLALYRRTEDGAYREAGRVKAHFLTVTGLDDERMEVSSWGKRLYVDRRAYEQYMRAQGAAFTNLMELSRN